MMKGKNDSLFLESEEYKFLWDEPHLGDHLIMLALAGSYAYGTNNTESDIDLRGVTLNQKSDLLGMTRFEQYVDEHTDTTIYSFNKLVKLVLDCNPNTIELLGLRPNNYLYLSPIGEELLQNKKLFLSKRAIASFGGYADAQLRRLQNAIARDSLPQREKEQHILNSIRNAMYDFKMRYTAFDNNSIRLFMDFAVHEDMETEIFMDINLTHYPLRDYRNIWAEMNNIVKDYDKIGKRNKKKDDKHLNKHAMHLIRLFMMAIDILEQGEINTYREKEHELLLDIRNGKYQKEDSTFREEFYELIADYEKKLEYAARNTNLPEEPDFQKVQDFVMYVNGKVSRDEF